MTAQQALRKIPQPFRDLIKLDHESQVEEGIVDEFSNYRTASYFIATGIVWDRTSIGREFYHAIHITLWIKQILHKIR